MWGLPVPGSPHMISLGAGYSVLEQGRVRISCT